MSDISAVILNLKIKKEGPFLILPFLILMLKLPGDKSDRVKLKLKLFRFYPSLLDNALHGFHFFAHKLCKLCRSHTHRLKFLTFEFFNNLW